MFALCGLAFGVILGISWLDVLLGGVLSIVSFGIVSLAARSRGLTTALELVVAAVAAALATLLPLVRVPRRCGPFMWGSRWGSSKGCGQCPTSSC